MDAMRHDGIRDGKEIVEYQLYLDNGKLVRFIYTATTLDSDEVLIFEHIVTSFTF